MILLAAAVAPVMAQPANDACTDATPLTFGTPVNGTTVGASADLEVTCQQDTADVWYSFTPEVFTSYTFHVTGEDNGSLSLAIISGCDFPIAEFACAPGAFDGPRLEILLFPGQQLLVRVGSTVGQSFTLEGDVSPPPANDECEGAVPLVVGLPVHANNYAATTTLELDNASLCSSIAPGVGGGADIFFSFTPTQDGYYDFSTCGAQLDTVVSVHSDCPVSAANALACNDNASLSRCDLPFDSNSSYVAGVQMTAGVTYYIRVAGVRFVDEGGNLGEPSRGEFDMLVQQGVAPVIPTNDECATATELPPDNAIFASTVNSTSSIPGVCGYDDVFDVWYTFTSSAFDRRAFQFMLNPAAFNNSASLTAFDACDGNVLACYVSNPLTSPEMVLWVVLDPGQTIKLRIAGNNGSQDDFTLFTSTSFVPGAVNDSCAAAQAISAGETVSADTSGTGTSDPTACGYYDIYPLWYSFTAPSDGYYRFSTDFEPNPEMSQNTTIAVYSACDTVPLACTTQGDGFSTNPAAAALAVRLDAGETRLFRVSFQAPYRGPVDVSVSGPLPAPPPVTNDTCATAQDISSMPFSTSVDVTLATPDQDVCAFEGQPLVHTPGGIWYTFTPDVERVFRAQLSTNGAHAARATLFTGSCGSLTQVTCPDGFPGDAGTVLTAGTTYSILVSLDEGDTGPIGEIPYATTVNIDFIAPARPANDHCDTAQRITSSSSVIDINTLSADADPPQPSCVGRNGVLNNAVWYSLTPTTSGTLTVHGEANDAGLYSPGGALFSGACGDLTEVACDSPVDGFFITFHFDFTADLEAGNTYYLVAGSWADPVGGETEITIDYTGQLGCAADFNADGTVNSQDFFDYLNNFFANDPAADFNADGTVNSQDFFDFLNAFFDGCN
jgi:hypothetical protein